MIIRLLGFPDYAKNSNCKLKILGVGFLLPYVDVSL